MKTRQGFVSNSSSSSFIVAAEKGENEKISLTLEVDLGQYGARITSKEELDEYVREEYMYNDDETLEEFLEDDPWLKDKYEKILVALEKGKVVFWGSASYNETDDPIELMIGNGGLRTVASNLEIIAEDG